MFIFTSVRGGESTTAVSLSEVTLYGADGEQVPVAEALNPGGQEGNSWEVPQSAVDGDVTTKWLDLNFYGEARLQLFLSSAQHVSEYELFTSTGPAQPTCVGIRPDGGLASFVVVRRLRS